MQFLKKHWLLIVGVLAAVYILFINKNTATIIAGITGSSVGNEAGSVIDPLSVKRYPPSGYSGPVGGPFKWAGLGDPPDGKYTTIGYTK